MNTHSFSAYVSDFSQVYWLRLSDKFDWKQLLQENSLSTKLTELLLQPRESSSKTLRTPWTLGISLTCAIGGVAYMLFGNFMGSCYKVRTVSDSSHSQEWDLPAITVFNLTQRIIRLNWKSENCVVPHAVHHSNMQQPQECAIVTGSDQSCS